MCCVPIPASWRHVQKVSYATSLMRQGVLISTTEHLLSVFYSMSVDNAFVEIDNLEVPILDGSAKPYVDAIRAIARVPGFLFVQVRTPDGRVLAALGGASRLVSDPSFDEEKVPSLLELC